MAPWLQQYFASEAHLTGFILCSWFAIGAVFAPLRCWWLNAHPAYNKSHNYADAKVGWRNVFGDWKEGKQKWGHFWQNFFLAPVILVAVVVLKVGGILLRHGEREL